MASHPTVVGERRVGPVYTNDAWFARLLAPHGPSVRIDAVRRAVMQIRELKTGAYDARRLGDSARRTVIESVMGPSDYHFDNPGIDRYLMDATWLGTLLMTGHSLRLAACDEYGNELVDSEPSK